MSKNPIAPDSGAGLPSPDLQYLDLPRLHAALTDIAVQAGRLALRDYRQGARTTALVHWKDGGSPVTDADLAVDDYLAGALKAVAPFAFHSEERPYSWTGDAEAPTFVVDPIDGTRNFSEGGDAWCIVIGVMAGRVPVAGVVHMPARRETFSAFSGGGAFLNATRLSTLPPSAQRLPPLAQPLPPLAQPLRVTGPRSVAERLAFRLGEPLVSAAPVPALAHRLLVPLAGRADLALARAGGHDWDIVASDCILREAGGQLLSLDGRLPDYRLAGGEHPPLMAGARGLLEKIGASLLTDTA